eukprot:1333582-Amorphochlora_amoeboformis.AAC.3
MTSKSEGRVDVEVEGCANCTQRSRHVMQNPPRRNRQSKLVHALRHLGINSSRVPYAIELCELLSDGHSIGKIPSAVEAKYWRQLLVAQRLGRSDLTGFSRKDHSVPWNLDLTAISAR